MSTALTSPACLGLHHFAHLRAVAEGLSVAEAARRYLGAERAVEVRTIHRALVERVAAVARRQGDARWRLLGIEIRAQMQRRHKEMERAFAETAAKG